METNDFMLQLAKQLMTTRGLAEATATAYVKALAQLNGKKAFKNLSFLKETDAIDTAIGSYAESTQRTLYATIVSVLSLLKGKAGYKKPYEHYYSELMKRTAEAKTTEAKNEKTEKQKANWLTWEEVTNRKAELTAAVDLFKDRKTITPAQYETLLQWAVLSLYTDLQPRRNADYLDMYIVKKHTDAHAGDKNYYDLANHNFIFNKYKTAKKYGTQREEVPEPLREVLAVYLKFHPLWRGVAKRKTEPVKLLVDAKGEPMTAVNAITRLLNRIFGKKVGSSMLRHIFLSDKYKDTLTEMKKDSEAMGHSLELQRAYVKKDGVEEAKTDD